MIIGDMIDEALLLSRPQVPGSVPRAEIVNMSAAGAGVLMPHRLKKGTPVTLQISGKLIPEVDIEAEVRWSAESPVSTGKYPMGLKFLQLDGKRQSKLMGIIEILRQHRPPQE